jgi:hypothetical protein
VGGARPDRVGEPCRQRHPSELASDRVLRLRSTEANGHAVFTRGDLSWLLGKPPTSKRPAFTRASKYEVRDGIATAVRYGWLAEGSCSECLIVPMHAIEGPLGDTNKVCPVHDRKARQQKAA